MNTKQRCKSEQPPSVAVPHYNLNRLARA